REKRRLARGEPADDAAMKLRHFRGGVRVVERVHPMLAADLGDARARFAADALGRRIRRNQAGVVFFDRTELGEEPIELRVADARIVEDVIAVVVRLDFVNELFVAFGGGSGGHRAATLTPLPLCGKLW